jgi:hypothetical protein
MAAVFYAWHSRRLCDSAWFLLLECSLFWLRLNRNWLTTSTLSCTHLFDSRNLFCITLRKLIFNACRPTPTSIQWEVQKVVKRVHIELLMSYLRYILLLFQEFSNMTELDLGESALKLHWNPFWAKSRSRRFYYVVCFKFVNELNSVSVKKLIRFCLQ